MIESERQKAEAVAKMEAIMRESPWRGLRLEAGGECHVEGEIGVWSFTTWRVVDAENGKIADDTRGSLHKGCRVILTARVEIFLVTLKSHVVRMGEMD